MTDEEVIAYFDQLGWALKQRSLRKWELRQKGDSQRFEFERARLALLWWRSEIHMVHFREQDFHVVRAMADDHPQLRRKLLEWALADGEPPLGRRLMREYMGRGMRAERESPFDEARDSPRLARLVGVLDKRSHFARIAEWIAGYEQRELTALTTAAPNDTGCSRRL